jgi:hypothetical protein
MSTHLMLTDDVLKQINATVDAKLRGLQVRLEDVCQADAELRLGLQECASFWGIQLMPRLVSGDAAVLPLGSEPSPPKKRGKVVSRHGMTVKDLCAVLPPILKQKEVGARHRVFTSSDVIEAMKGAGLEHFKSGWVSLVLSKPLLSGITKVGTVKNPGRRKMNTYKLNGESIELVQTGKQGKKKRRRRRRKAASAVAG